MFARNNDKFRRIFSCQKELTSAVGVEEIDEDGNIYEELKIEKKKPKVPKYLPGQRLLLKLNKQKHDRIKLDQKSNTPDVNKITNSVNNLLNIF
jgi:hypothetical protein